MAEVSESMEIATLDKEMAEEKVRDGFFCLLFLKSFLGVVFIYDDIDLSFFLLSTCFPIIL